MRDISSELFVDYTENWVDDDSQLPHSALICLHYYMLAFHSEATECSICFLG